MLWQAVEVTELDRAGGAAVVPAQGSPHGAPGGGPSPATGARPRARLRAATTASRARRGASLPARLALVAALALAGAGCGMPRDPRGTLDRVRGGTLRAGVAEHAPWVTLRGGEPAGIEPQLLREFARELGARVAWAPGTEAELMDALARGELDIVASGLTRSTAWGDHVALTRPHRTTRTAAGRRREHVLAVPPGENGWLRQVERFLAARGASAPAPAPGASTGLAR